MRSVETMGWVCSRVTMLWVGALRVHSVQRALDLWLILIGADILVALF